MTLPEFPELHFDEDKHLYTLDKQGVTLELPSVTQILRFVSREIYEGIPLRNMEHAADRGTRVHAAIEMLDGYIPVETDEEIMPYILAYEAWEREYGFKTVASEYRIYHRTRLYAGTVDRLFMDGEDICLMDVKTSLEVLEGLATAQLCGYSEALKSHGIEIKNSYILHLGKDAAYSFIPVDTSKGQTMFNACAYLHGAIKGKGIS